MRVNQRTQWPVAERQGDRDVLLDIRESTVVDLRAEHQQGSKRPRGRVAVSSHGDLLESATTTLELPGPGSHLERVRNEQPQLRQRRKRFVIRVLDVIGAVSVGLAVLPVVACIALILRLTDRGPVFFSQERMGRSGETFHCLKFRTMHVDAEVRLQKVLEDPQHAADWKHSQKLRSDPRITPLGRLLRRYDLDELPQLWNVFNGQMSLVGPRPIPLNEVELFGSDLGTVLSVKPGMTGLWQVSGRNRLPHWQRVMLDVSYAQRQSVAVNLALLLRTAQMLVDPAQRIE